MASGFVFRSRDATLTHPAGKSKLRRALGVDWLRRFVDLGQWLSLGPDHQWMDRLALMALDLSHSCFQDFI